MFSGKTSEVLSYVRRMRAIGRQVLVVNHALDDRGGDPAVCSHDQVRAAGTLSLTRLDDDALWEQARLHDAVVVDEAQFFGPELVEAARRLVAMGKDVLVVGLDGDHQQRPFGHLRDLLPLADEFSKLRAFCAVCRDGTPAPFTRRTVGGGHGQVLVGGAEAYEPACRSHLAN